MSGVEGLRFDPWSGNWDPACCTTQPKRNVFLKKAQTAGPHPTPYIQWVWVRLKNQHLHKLVYIQWRNDKVLL